MESTTQQFETGSQKRGLRFGHDTQTAKLWAIRKGESQWDYEARMFDAGLLPGREDRELDS